VGQGIVLAITRAIVGIGVTLVVTRYLKSMLYDIHANDPATIVGDVSQASPTATNVSKMTYLTTRAAHCGAIV
jgi:hypothetical protein